MSRMDKEVALIDWANGQVGLPFKKGETDCNILTLSVFDIYRDTEHMQKIYKKYSTYIAGSKLAKEEFGVDRISKFLDKEAERIPVELVTAGDILVKCERRYDACTICLGSHFLDANAEEGIVKISCYSLDCFKGFVAYRL